MKPTTWFCQPERVPAQAWVTLIVGGLAAVGVIVTWQRRTQWAFERTFSADGDEARLGWAAVAASRRTGRPVDRRVKALAESP